jgi:hypothetical protein
MAVVPMVLNQQNAPNGPIQTLPGGQNDVETGAMGDCVSVVVLWNNVGGQFQNVRGYHGGGGFGNVNVAGLIAGVPNNAGTRIVACIGTVAAASNDVQRVQNWHGASIPNATLVIANGHGNYRVNRNGQWIGL